MSQFAKVRKDDLSDATIKLVAFTNALNQRSDSYLYSELVLTPANALSCVAICEKLISILGYDDPSWSERLSNLKSSLK